MSDEGFHEIQLNGKQLVFLFMAATVVSVVIFLLGVMVGRGVPSPRVQAAAITSDSSVDPTAIESGGAAASASSDRTPVSAQESLTYAERLAAPTPAQETLKETEVVLNPPPPAKEPVTLAASAPPPPAPKPAPPAPAQTPAPPAAPAAAAAGLQEPAGTGYAVQVGATTKDNAEQIAKRLASKGYPVFILPRSQGLFAVRVGKYANKSEADAVAARLEQQEQFNKPWVTR